MIHTHGISIWFPNIFITDKDIELGDIVKIDGGNLEFKRLGFLRPSPYDNNVSINFEKNTVKLLENNSMFNLLFDEGIRYFNSDTSNYTSDSDDSGHVWYSLTFVDCDSDSALCNAQNICDILNNSNCRQ